MNRGIAQRPIATPPDAGRRRRRQLAVLFVASMAVIAALSLTSPWKLLELRTFDYLTTLQTPALPADSPVIVAIDEPSLANIQSQWPWPRALHARLIDSLRAAGAKAIGIDIIFAEPSPVAENDAALEAALGPDVVLAGDETLIRTPQADQLLRTEPLARFVAKGAATGIASVNLDEDGILRDIPPMTDAFAAQLAAVAGRTVARADNRMMQVFGPARTYPTASYYQALEPETFLPPGFFKDRIVLVGLSLQAAPAIDSSATDAFATPSTIRTGLLVSGVEVQATLFDNLTRGFAIDRASRTTVLLTILFGGLLGALMVYRETGWHTVLLSLVAIIALATATYVVLRLGHLFAAPVGPVVSFVAVVLGQTGLDYATERRTRRQITRAFSQYLSPALVERLAQDPSQLRLGGERRTLSILFSDVRGFTTIAERLKDNPEHLTTLINRLLTPLSEEVLECGGTIDKYIGDCLMAFWNAPLDDAEHALHAVEAGLRMLDAMERVNDELRREAQASGTEPFSLKVGVGINTGDCVVGNMGSVRRFDYSALGDSVNLASRLEGESKNVGVSMLLGETTARLLAAHYTIVELDRLTVKGRTVASPVFTVLRQTPTSDSLAEHHRILQLRYDGALTSTDPALRRLAVAIPELAHHYTLIRQHLDLE